jgi:hypothetical protein
LAGLFYLLRKEYLNELKEYKDKHGFSKKEFLEMRKQMNPEYRKFNLRQFIQDLSKN